MNMVFTVLAFDTLNRLMEIDNYISVVWNNKYLTAGEFEIVMETTPEKIIKVVRNNYIALNGTKEIAIIDLVTYSADEENGATMTVKGTFVQSLLGRRIIWDKTNLSGNIEDGLQGLITSNAIDPDISDRAITLDMLLLSLRGKEINYPASHFGVRNIQIINDFEVINYGTPNGDGTLSGFEYTATTPKIYVEYDGKSILIEYLEDAYKSTGARNHGIVSNPLDSEVKTIIYHDESEIKYTRKCHWAKISDICHTGSRSLSEPYGSLLSYSYNQTSTDGGGILEFSFDVGLSIQDDKYFSSGLVKLTKEQFEKGGYGLSIYDNAIHIRRKLNDTTAQQLATNAGLPYSMLGEYPFEVFRGAIGATYSGFNLFDSMIMYNLETTETLTTKDEWYVNRGEIKVTYTPESNLPLLWDKFTKASFETSSGLDGDYIYSEYLAQNPSKANYLELGNKAGLVDEIELQVFGENLETKIEELLELYGCGMKCRYEKTEKKIYIDFYKGIDRTKNIIFSESMDNLTSYIVNVGNVEANVALVYTKVTKDNTETEYTAESGLGAGISRKEMFLNRSENPGYGGSDLAKQLEQEGTLSLNSMETSIETEIDPYSYKYRNQFNLGDIVKMVIKDLGITYNLRILEVREYNDENGYSIDLVLGE